MEDAPTVAAEAPVRRTLGQIGAFCAAAAMLFGMPLLLAGFVMLSIRDIPWESTPTIDLEGLVVGATNGAVGAVEGAASWLVSLTWGDLMWVAIGWACFLVSTSAVAAWGGQPEATKQA